MSQWTHVAGIVRIDALAGILPFGTPGNPDLKKLLGPMCLFDAWDETSTLPRGSEGSIHYAVEGPPEQSHLAAYVVSLWGDLRDYNSVDEIHDWLTKTFDGLMIRQAVVTVEPEGYGFTTIVYQDGQFVRLPTPSREQAQKEAE